MSQPVSANFYDGRISAPREAIVSIREPSTLEVEVDGERFHWPLEDKGMRWERTSDTLRLSFGEFPRRVLIVRDELFIKSFVMRMQYAGRRGVYDRVVSIARAGPVLFLVGVLAVLVLGYVYALPWAAEGIAMLLPRSLDVQLGDASFHSVALRMEEDTVRTKALQRFGDQLALSDHYELRYHVVKEDQVNAFAMPGGHIVVFTGILDRMDDPGQLAALLAHEATHVEERHSTRMLMRQMSSYVFLSLLLGDVNAVVAVVAQNADNIRHMSYSRDLESDADGLGMDRMHASGMDPQGMVRLLELLEEAGDMPEAVSFLLSHPLTTERIERAAERAERLGHPTQHAPDLRSDFEQAIGN